MTLRDWMAQQGLNDAALADLIGNISAEQVRKIRFRTRGTTLRVAARIGILSKGQVGPNELTRRPRKAA